MTSLQQQPDFPLLLTQLHQLEFDYADGDGIDFEPYQHFMSIDDTQDWFKAWTGNPDADARDYLIFGQDGTGGYAAIWTIRQNYSLLDQPVVFFGSEGELGIVAANFSDYLWLLAANYGPYEAVAYPNDTRPSNVAFSHFAQQHATTPQHSATEILKLAHAEFPDFNQFIEVFIR